jgi:hypothetical protein
MRTMGRYGLGCFLVAAGGCYVDDLRALESELTERQSVTRIQEWLALTSPLGYTSIDADKWPECIRELRPIRVHGVEKGNGVVVMMRRGDVYSLVVFPQGRRPAISEHEPSGSRPGYLGAFGPDAYIAMTER